MQKWVYWLQDKPVVRYVRSRLILSHVSYFLHHFLLWIFNHMPTYGSSVSGFNSVYAKKTYIHSLLSCYVTFTYINEWIPYFIFIIKIIFLCIWLDIYVLYLFSAAIFKSLLSFFSDWWPWTNNWACWARHGKQNSTSWWAAAEIWERDQG